METWLILGGSRFGMLERRVYKASSEDQRRAFLRGAYRRSAMLVGSVLGSPPANREGHSVGQSQRGKHDADRH